MKTSGPGPKYNLPSLTGYDGHDLTRFRYPAITCSPRYPGERVRSDAPAPKYFVGQNTRYGPMESRSAFILGKQKYTYQITPGPGRYAPEQHPDPRYKTAPSSTLGIRPVKIIGTKTPGATKYNVPTTIGPQVIDKRASPAYTMLGRNIKFTEGNRSPGPGRYGVSPIDCYKKRSRSANILGPYQFIQTKKGIPGPKYSWTINEKREPPAYSFGVRHSLKKIIYYHPADLGESAL